MPDHADIAIMRTTLEMTVGRFAYLPATPNCVAMVRDLLKQFNREFGANVKLVRLNGRWQYRGIPDA